MCQSQDCLPRSDKSAPSAAGAPRVFRQSRRADALNRGVTVSGAPRNRGALFSRSRGGRGRRAARRGGRSRGGRGRRTALRLEPVAGVIERVGGNVQKAAARGGGGVGVQLDAKNSECADDRHAAADHQRTDGSGQHAMDEARPNVPVNVLGGAGQEQLADQARGVTYRALFHFLALLDKISMCRLSFCCTRNVQATAH